jgi:NAD(P)-dependent dehydrogenase (short-subunit alcohol dehydrogenase family)
MPRNLRDKVLVITGASAGIGAATARAAADAGMHVVLNARSADRLAAVADEIRAAGREAAVVVGDVTGDGHSDRLLDAALEHFGRFDVVFANAGMKFCQPVHEVAPAALRRIFDVNLFAAVDLLQHAARRLIAARQTGHLLMCSSAVAKFTFSLFSAYSATKAAQNHICRAMRMELKLHGIDVTSVHPATTRTDLFRRATEYEGRTYDPQAPFGDSPTWYAQPPERVAAAIIRCLRRPRAEVWTSGVLAVGAALMTIFPELGDYIDERFQRRRRPG